jgi:hypothetical protein
MQDVSISIIGIGKLPHDASDVFENVSSLTGGLYHNIANIEDLQSFTRCFVKVFADAVANPTGHALQVRERQVEARRNAGIYDNLVMRRQFEEAQMLETHLQDLEGSQSKQSKELKQVEQAYSELMEMKTQLARSQSKQSKLEDSVEELKIAVGELKAQLQSVIAENNAASAGNRESRCFKCAASVHKDREVVGGGESVHQ